MSVDEELAVKKIIASFTEQDNEAVYSEVEVLDKQFSINDFTKMMRKNLPSMEQEVLELGSDSTKYQDLVSAAIWDALTELVKHQRALEIYKRMNHFDEVA